jgi:superfamily II DNA or RNA helicase/uncharacterized protein (DUF3820 family)
MNDPTQSAMFDTVAYEPRLDRAGKLTPRPYQAVAVDSVFRELNAGVRSTLLVYPTGTGKTVIFADLALRWPLGRVMVVAHKRILVQQAAEKLALHLGYDPEIEMAKQRSRIHRSSSRVFVASIQTLTSTMRCGCIEPTQCRYCCGSGKALRMTKFDPAEFGLVILDEAHHCAAVSYRRFIAYMSDGNPDLRVVGCTATPDRGDRLALGSIFATTASAMPLTDAIEDGWLVAPHERSIVVDGLDFRRVKTTAGDLNQRQLANVMMGRDVDADSDVLSEEEVAASAVSAHRIAAPTVAECGGKTTLVFGVDKAHVKALTEAFNSYDGIIADYVIDETPEQMRQIILRRYNAGEINVLVGCGVFLEGFDCDRIQYLAIGRPTKVRSLYCQMVGRGTRPLAGVIRSDMTRDERLAAIAASAKSRCVVLDFTGNAGRHNLCSLIDIYDGEWPEDLVDEAASIIADSDEAIDPREAIKQAEAARLKREMERRAKEEQERANRERLMATARYHVEQRGTAIHTRPFDAGGAGLHCSMKQAELLRKLGVNDDAIRRFTPRQAGAVIDERLRRVGGEMRVFFGKFAGRKLSDLPRQYIEWCLQNMSDQVLKAKIARNVAIMRGLVNQDADGEKP